MSSAGLSKTVRRNPNVCADSINWRTRSLVFSLFHMVTEQTPKHASIIHSQDHHSNTMKTTAMNEMNGTLRAIIEIQSILSSLCTHVVRHVHKLFEKHVIRLLFMRNDHLPLFSPHLFPSKSQWREKERGSVGYGTHENWYEIYSPFNF
jgi:hypothetical protein